MSMLGPHSAAAAASQSARSTQTGVMDGHCGTTSHTPQDTRHRNESPGGAILRDGLPSRDGEEWKQKGRQR